ncbi:hypothetical protein [Microbispora sp. NPDC049125]|uniref:hypothetical protein n=1 Tax=Microbispora sp. NPDC049125 TaxID=3154929 RepID=UPI0034652212
MIASPIREVRENAKAAFQAALFEGVDLEDRLDGMLDTFLRGLQAIGYVTSPTERPTAEELDDYARELARRSEFARYAGAGWQLLRRHPNDVKCAYLKAADLPGANLAELAAYRSLLLAHTEHIEDCP